MWRLNEQAAAAKEGGKGGEEGREGGVLPAVARRNADFKRQGSQLVIAELRWDPEAAAVEEHARRESRGYRRLTARGLLMKLTKPWRRYTARPQFPPPFLSLLLQKTSNTAN